MQIEVLPRHHYNWKGGRYKDGYGYWRIYKPEHPYAHKRGYILEHRWVVEQHIGRYLKPTEVVHHKNRNRGDNRIENLELFDSHSKHISFENIGNKWGLEDMSRRKCCICGSKKTSLRKSENNRPHWYGTKEKPICSRCYQRNKKSDTHSF